MFWTKFVEEEYGQIFWRTYSQGSWSAEQQITSGEGYAGFPSVAVDSKGVLHLVWYGFDGTTYQVYYSRYEFNNWSTPVRLSQGYPDSVNPTIAVDSKDNLHVAWYKSNGHQYQIYYVQWAGSWGDQVILSSGLTDSLNPTMAVDRLGRVYVFWDKGEAGQTQIYFALFKDGAWSGQIPITSGDLAAENPSVAVDDLGTAYVFYEKTDGQIYLREYSERWSDEMRLTYSGINTFPSVRWSYNNNPFNSEGGKIEYVWTSDDNGTLSLKYSNLAIAQAMGPATNLGLLANPVVITGAFVAVAALLLFYQSRRKRVT